MSSARSIIGELYGVETARRPARQGGLGLAIVMLLGGIFLYESIHPVMRLRSEPPSFRETAATKDHQVPVAGSYWNRAASFMSENYAYGELLPTKPPKDFTTAMGGDYITSSIYWQKVRSSWNQPENWVQSYRF
ncbi:MAG TPA: hypothetical protein VFZ27_04720, partial [Terriglobia bacterium]|nr:hypothetical protein [Terriglobia bacterium]